MTTSELVPLATVAGSVITALFALGSANRTARTTLQSSYTNQRLDTVVAYLEAIDEFTESLDNFTDVPDDFFEDPDRTRLATVRATSQRVRLVFFSDGDPVAIAKEIDTTCRALVAVFQTGHYDGEAFEKLQEMAVTRYVDEDDDETEYQRANRLRAATLLTEVKAVRKRQDEAIEAGQPEPDITDTVTCLAQRSGPRYKGREIEIRRLIGTGTQRHERSTRPKRAQELRDKLTELRGEFVDAVSEWLAHPPKPGRRERRRRSSRPVTWAAGSRALSSTWPPRNPLKARSARADRY